MSLLLDALKKAAEKKAQKDAESKAVENTEVLTRTRVTNDKTIADETLAMTETELDATSIDATQLDKTSADTTLKIGSTQVDATQADHESTLELDIKNLDLSKLAAEENEVIFDSGADDSLSFIDEEEVITDDKAEDETIVLTPDDITDFLGDGNYPKQTKPEKVVPPPVRHEISDDTTLTNPDAISLTDIDRDSLDLEPVVDKDYSQAQDSTRTESANYNSYDGILSRQERGRGTSSSVQPGEGSQSTMMNADSTSVDIEKLTNDETVTIKDSTFTRTFAPDNYDRTLMKLTDNNVSRIFSGMRSETDSVMTPDYAKKIFITKSRGVKNYYYKVYAGIALCILLVVVVWGLFEIQSESESIDNSLIALKRDPMPGVIKPKRQSEPVNLFSSAPKVDNNAIKVIEKASKVADGVSGEVQQKGSAIQAEDIGEVAVQSVSPNDSVDSLGSQQSKSPAVKAKANSVKKQPSAQSKQASLQISSNKRVSEKDQILAEAYAAYEAGDIDKARRQYQQVIALDPENRDALLGRAAIYVLDNQFERAITLYQKLLLANPKDDLAMTSLISVANVDPQTGETEIKRLLNDLPESPYLHFALGNMFGNQNRWAEAQTEYFKALQIKPEDPNYAYNMAVSLEHLQKSDSAITFYERALKNKINGLATFSESLVVQRIEVLSQ